MNHLNHQKYDVFTTILHPPMSCRAWPISWVQVAKSQGGEPLVVEVVHWEDHICRRSGNNKKRKMEEF